MLPRLLTSAEFLVLCILEPMLYVVKILDRHYLLKFDSICKQIIFKEPYWNTSFADFSRYFTFCTKFSISEHLGPTYPAFYCFKREQS